MDWLFEKMFGVVLPSNDIIEWIFSIYEWLLVEKGGIATLDARSLVLPTNDFFPVENVERKALANALFKIVKRHAGMLEWPCRVEMVEEEEDPGKAMGALLGKRSRSSAAGTFRWSESDGTAVISYTSSQLDDIDALIATFAHELGHFYLSPVKTQPPGGDIASEPATDICATFLGFGIFTANSAFRFKELRGINTSGYSATRLGYLNEASLAYALAIFTELKGIPPETAGVHLKANPRSFHRNAVKDIRRRWMARFKRLRKL